MKKLLAILLASIMLVSFVSCSSEPAETPAEDTADTATTEDTAEDAAEEPAGEVLTIEYYQQKGEEGPQKGYQEIVDRFNAEYPQYIVEMNTVPDPGEVLTSRIASGDIPPIFTDFPTQIQFEAKIENGYIEELTGQDFLSRVNPSAIEMSTSDNGGIYALPYSNNFYGIFYNIDIFEEHGIEIPTTHDELIEVFETLEAAGVQPLGIDAKDPGRIGHMFQGMNVAYMAEGIETIEAVVAGEATLTGNAEYQEFARKMLEIFSYANDDALGVTHNILWEEFANGKYAMTPTGSYSRGTMMIANPDANLGIFPIPNDSVETTNTLSGIDSAVALSAHATDAEKEAGIMFLEFLTRTENAQIFCDNDGAPSCITEVVYKDAGTQPMIDIIQDGRVHDWAAATIPGNITGDIYSVAQGFLIHQNIDQFLEEMDASIELTSAQ